MMPRFNVQDVEEAYSRIDPVFLHSPQFECEPLSDYLGSQILLKVETMNPIRSFKGRGADLLVQQARTPLICASAGNFGQAMAYCCRKYNVPLTIVASVHANAFKVERMKALGAMVILQGNDFDAAKEFARQLATERNERFVEDSADVETAIGAGTIALELLRSPEEFEVLLVPIGNGALINGIGRVYKDRKSSTRILGVQAKGAPAMVESWKAKRRIIHNSIHTIADGIGVRIPVQVALEDMEPVLDDALLVSEDALLLAIKILFQKAGILAEPSGAAGLAAIIEHAQFKSMKVGVILCGSNLTGEQMNSWLS
jgi:threonine dehydratase